MTSVVSPGMGVSALIVIESDNVDAADSHDAIRTILVRFPAGSVHSCAPVPAAVWDDLVAAQPHLWSRVRNPVAACRAAP